LQEESAEESVVWSLDNLGLQQHPSFLTGLVLESLLEVQEDSRVVPWLGSLAL
jgi:hypothetical protein